MWTWIIVLILIAIVLLLCVPFDLQISLFTQKRPVLQIDLNWAFKLLNFRLYPGLKKKKSASDVITSGQSSVQTKKRHRPDGWQLFLDIWHIEGILPWVVKLMQGLRRSLHLREIKGSVKFSVEEPQTYAYLFIFCWYVNQVFAGRGHNFTLDAVFEGQYEFDSMSTVVVRIIPIILLMNLVACVFSPVFFRLTSRLMRSA